MFDLFVKKAYAIEITNPFSKGPLSSSDAQTSLNNVIGTLVNVVFAAAGLLFLAMLFTGGIAWITAGGDPKNVAAARSRITNALIGLVIVVAAFAISQLILNVLGLNSFVNITTPIPAGTPPGIN